MSLSMSKSIKFLLVLLNLVVLEGVSGMNLGMMELVLSLFLASMVVNEHFEQMGHALFVVLPEAVSLFLDLAFLILAVLLA